MGTSQLMGFNEWIMAWNKLLINQLYLNADSNELKLLKSWQALINQYYLTTSFNESNIVEELPF